jgi:hypothetical protein
LLVAFFLAGLVVLSGQQQWWLQSILLGMSSEAIFFGTMLLTAITDNAVLTYLGSLVEGLSDSFKYALVQEPLREKASRSSQMRQSCRGRYSAVISRRGPFTR